MACACKKRDKIVKMLTRPNVAQPNTSVSDLLLMVFGAIRGGIILCLCIILIPFFIIFLAINYLIKGDMNFDIPKSLQNFLRKDE